MAKNKKLVNFVSWLVGVIVTLALGSALAGKTLTLPAFIGGATVIGMWIAVIAGWLLMISAILAIVMKLLGKL